MAGRIIAAVIAVLAAALVAVPPAAATTSFPPGVPSLVPDDPWIQPNQPELPTADQRITYPDSGYTLAAWDVGDVNGDRLDDFALSDGGADGYISFSQAAGGTRTVLDPGSFHVATAGGRWTDVAPVGDINGDGLGDIAIAQANGVAIVFGKHDDSPVDLANLGAGGFTVAGAAGHVAGLGDLNGDGVPDFAVGTGDGAAVVYPARDAPGTTIDVTVAGPYVGTIASGTVASLGNLGDAGGDGRNDLVLATGSTAHGLSVPGPGQSTSVDSGGFAVGVDDGPISAARPIGDQNGDGRRDLVVAADHKVRIVYSPPFGATLQVADLGAGPDANGYTIPRSGYYGAQDIGDQNGDGRSDVGGDRTVFYTGPTGSDPVTGGFDVREETLVAPVSDLNGDGRPELAGIFTLNGTQSLDVLDSVPAPKVGVLTVQADDTGTVTATAAVSTGAGGGRNAADKIFLNSRLQVQRPDGSACNLIPFGASKKGVRDATVIYTSSGFNQDCGLAAGRTASARLEVGNGRGGVAYSSWERFVARKFNPYRPPAQPGGVGITIAIVLRGTPKADRLVGTAEDERIFGNSGNDRIDGGDGNDFIDAGAGDDVVRGGRGDDSLIGGGGKDRIYAGPGKDWINSYDSKGEVVDCGAGKDTVVADKKDRLRHCEKVRRRR